jgi:hypothetical protein
MGGDEADEWDLMLEDDGMVEIGPDVSTWPKQVVEESQETFKTGCNNPCNTFVLHSVVDTKAWVHYYLEEYRREEFAERSRKESELHLGRKLGEYYDETLGEM